MYYTTIDKKSIPIEQLEWVKSQPNGVYVNCPEWEGEGIIIEGEIYHVTGKPVMDKPSIDLIWKDDVSNLIKTSAQTKSITEITFFTLAANGQIDDVTISEHPTVFPEWVSTAPYSKGDIVQYETNVYRCVQNHEAQHDWSPPKTPALWSRIGSPEDLFPLWSQPLGAHDAYEIGSKVSYDGEHWESIIDANIWAPSVYGWTLYNL